MTGTQVAPVPAIIGGSNDIPPLKTPTLPIKSIESVHLRTSIAGTDNVIGVVHTSTFMNGSGDSKKLTKDMDKKEITVNGSKLGDSTPSNKLPQQTVSSSGTILKNDCIDLDKNFVAVDLKNLKDNSLLVNNLKSIGVGVRAPINASTLNGNTTQKMNTKAVNGTTFETDEDTSSSEHSSEDETERMLRAKWEREQVDIAWRWHWLDLQTRELQYQIQQADQQYLKLRRNKQPVVPPLEDFDTLRSLRTSSMGTLKKSRKLCRRAPTNLSGRIVEGAEPHPLFSFAERKASLRSSLAGSRDPGSPEISPPVKSEQPKRRRDSSRKREVKDVIKKEVEEDDVATRPNRKRRNTDDSPHSPVSPTTPLATPKMSEKKKKTLKTRDFDIDNVVIPFGMGSACSIPVIQYKEIITPKWRSVDAPDFDGKKGSRKRKALSPINTPEQSPLPSPKLSPMVVEVSTTHTLPASSPKVPLLQAPPFKRFSNSKNSKSPATPNTPLENSQESVPTKTFSCVSENPPARFSILSDDQPSECTTGGEDSSDEDTSDEAFARRHMKQELTERQRYLLPKKKNAADAVANDTTITNLFVTSHDDLLSTYSPKPGGSLLPAELFTEPNNEDSTPTTPMDLSRSTTSLSVKKDKLKEKFAKMRHSMDDSQSEGHRVSRTSSAPSKLSSKSPKASMPSGSETESEDSSEEDEEEEEEEEEGPEPPKKEEEEYVEGQKNKPVDGQKRRSRKFQPIRTRSRAKAMAVAAAAQAVQQKPQPKSKPPPTKKSTKKPAAEKSTPAPTPSPKSATMPTTSSSPSTTTATPLVAESDDGYLSDEEDWDEWEASCDKNNKWWWEPAHWEVISEELAESAESESQALFIRLYRTPIAACASVPSALDVPTPTFPGDATAEELAVAQTLKETPMVETTATETDAQKPTCTLSDSSLTLESSSTVEGPSVVSHSTLLAMEVDTQPADDIVMADTVHPSTAVEEVPTEKPMEAEGPTRVNDVTTSVDEVIAIEVPTTFSTHDADSAVDTTVDSIMDTTATDIDTSTDLDLSITCESKTTTTTTTVFDVLPTTNENTAVPTNTNTFDTYTDAETPTHIPPPSEPQHPQPTMPAPTQQQSSPPTTPPQLIASPDDDILLISPLRSDSDDYTLLPHSHPPSHSHTHTPPSPSHLPSLDTRDNIVFPAHHNNPVE